MEKGFEGLEPISEMTEQEKIDKIIEFMRDDLNLDEEASLDEIIREYKEVSKLKREIAREPKK